MSDAAEQHLPNEMDVVVNDDETGMISAEQMQRLGLSKGSHLRVVPVKPRLTLDEIFAARDARREAAGIEPMTDEEAAEFADKAVKEVRRRIYAEG